MPLSALKAQTSPGHPALQAAQAAPLALAAPLTWAGVSAARTASYSTHHGNH